MSLSVNPGGGAGYSAGISGGNTSGDTGTVSNQLVFAGGNNITLSGSTNAGGMTVTISGANAGGAQTGISGIIVSNATYTSGTVSFSNANGISFGSSAGQAITASYTVPSTAGLISAVGVTGQNGNFTTTGLSFSNANGVSFGTSAGSAITASVAAQTNQTVGGYFVGNTTGASSSSTVDARSISFDGAGIVSAGWSNGTVRISATQSNQAFSADASSTFQTLSFQNSNGVSFSNNAGALRVTHALAGTATAITGLASMTVNSGGISFNGTGLAGTGTTFNGANISGSMTVNTAGVNLSMSVAAPGGGAATQTLYATGNTTVNSSGTVALSSVLMRGYGVLSLGTSNGSVLFSTPDPVTLAPNWYAVGNTTGASSSSTLPADTISIQGAGGVSVGFTNGSMVISGGAGASPAASASNGSFTFATLAFSNANNVTFGTSAGGIITASVAAPGAAAENNAINLLGANTAGNTTASGSTIGWSGVNLTLSGTNASQVVISAPATSSLVGTNGISISTNGSTISVSYVPAVNSRFVNEPAITTTGLAADRSSVSIVPFVLQNYLDFSNVRVIMSMSGQTTTNNSTNGAAISLSGVLYSLNGSTLSSILSGSNTFTASWSSNATATVFGARALTFAPGGSTRLPPGEYWWGMHVSSATTAQNTSGTSNLTHAFTMGIGAANLTQMLGADPWNNATAATRGASIGLGLFSTGATRGTIAISDIQQTGSRAQAAKLWVDMRNYSVW